MYSTPIVHEKTYGAKNPGSELSGVIDMMLLTNVTDMVMTMGEIS